MSTTDRKWNSATARQDRRTTCDSEHLGHWHKAMAFYQRNKPRLLKDDRYAGKFIAVREQRIVDVDEDQSVLTSRLEKRFPDQVYFVTRVQAHEPVYEVPSFTVIR